MRIIYEGEYYADGEANSFRLEDTVPFVITRNITFATEELLSPEASLELYINDVQKRVVNDYTCEKIGFYLQIL